MRVILASKSPRRREYLAALSEELGFCFEIITEDTDETLVGEYPFCGVEELAIRKGAAVAAKYPEALVISSDTLVELDGKPLGKPCGEAEAVKMLASLSNRSHNVHTGVAVHCKGRIFSGVRSTAVRFREISAREIDYYVSTGEPMDKAGAYGIQGYAGRFVEGYDGDFDTVVGLSVSLLKELLCECGFIKDGVAFDD